MAVTAIIFFLIAAIMGAILLSYVLRNKNTPKALAFTHGTFAAIGIVLLIVCAVICVSKPVVSLTLFIIAALGGFTLIYRDLTGKTLPKWLAVGHGLIAVTAFIFLLIFVGLH